MNINHLLIFLLLSLVSLSSSAQIVFDNDSFKDNSVDRKGFDYSIKAYLTNNATNPDDTLFKWKVVSLSQPSNWELQVCTDGECIADPPLERTHPFILPVGEKEEFKIGWALFEIAGDGLVTVVVSSTNHPENADTVTLEIATLSNIKKINNFNIKVNPNPINDHMFVDFSNDSYKTIVMYDILGNKVFSKQVFSGESINTSEINKGVYIIKIEGLSDFSKVIHKN
ncbi:MAG: T9SS type A sorting domain-containing protein [Bacteroidia bacterium]|jgi:hypothetical protein|nr:T9SS type A sorting domain-containing protein [Bacteroidia bacterium]